MLIFSLIVKELKLTSRYLFDFQFDRRKKKSVSYFHCDWTNLCSAESYGRKLRTSAKVWPKNSTSPIFEKLLDWRVRFWFFECWINKKNKDREWAEFDFLQRWRWEEKVGSFREVVRSRLKINSKLTEISLRTACSNRLVVANKPKRDAPWILKWWRFWSNFRDENCSKDLSGRFRLDSRFAACFDRDLSMKRVAKTTKGIRCSKFVFVLRVEKTFLNSKSPMEKRLWSRCSERRRIRRSIDFLRWLSSRMDFSYRERWRSDCKLDQNTETFRSRIHKRFSPDQFYSNSDLNHRRELIYVELDKESMLLCIDRWILFCLDRKYSIYISKFYNYNVERCPEISIFRFFFMETIKKV